MTQPTDGSPELAQLYRRLAPRLRRIIGVNLAAPDCLLDDACQAAWAALVAQPVRGEESQVLSWLATTARRQALAMLRRAEVELGDVGEEPPAAERERSDPHCAAEFWERLGQMRRLSRRQRQMLWMQGLGYEYREIAARTGGTERTVERQLSDARRRLAEAA